MIYNGLLIFQIFECLSLNKNIQLIHCFGGLFSFSCNKGWQAVCTISITTKQHNTREIVILLSFIFNYFMSHLNILSKPRFQEFLSIPSVPSMYMSVHSKMIIDTSQERLAIYTHARQTHKMICPMYATYIYSTFQLSCLQRRNFVNVTPRK